MRYFVRIILLSILLISGTKLHATHLMGGEILYKELSSKKYEVTLNIYRDCRGIPLNSVPLTVSCDGSNARNITTIRQAIIEITPLNPTEPARCNPVNNRSGMGIEKHIYTAILDFNTVPLSTLANCSGMIRMSTSIPARNGAINTGPSGTFFAFSELDLSEGNSSPVFGFDPIAFMCCNQPTRLSAAAAEVDGDSISYEWTPPLRGYNQQLSYSGTNYSYTNPFQTYLPGSLRPPANFPNANPPIGLHLNTKTGDIIFTPTRCDEVSVASLKVIEWRKDQNGTMRKVGTVTRDIQTITTTCPNNNPPSLNGPLKKTYHITNCLQNLVFEIDAKDLPFIPPPPLLPPGADSIWFIIPDIWPEGITHQVTDIDSVTKRLTVNINNSYLEAQDYASHELFLTFQVWDDAAPFSAINQSTIHLTFEKDTANATAKVIGSVIDDSNKDCNFSGIEDTALYVREIMIQDSLDTYYSNTKQDGTFDFCLGADSIDVKLSPSPWFDHGCGDSSFRASADSIYDITLYSKINDGVSGFTFQSEDSLCIRSSATLPLSGQRFIIEPGKTIVSSDAKGMFLFSNLSPGTYTIKPILDSTSRHDVICKDSLIITYNGSGNIQLDDFFFQKTVEINPGVHPWSLWQRRLVRGREHLLSLQLTGLENVDSVDLYAQVTTDVQVNLAKSSNGWIDLGGNLFKNTYKQFYSSSFYYLRITPPASKYGLGDTVPISFYIDTLNRDTQTQNNKVDGDFRIIAPYDPNIKTTQEDSIFTVDNRFLEYTITFQNTGNSPAQKVVVRDTLPDILDISKIEFLGASHEYYPLMDNRKLWFVFDDINLPDSSSDKSGSIGSVTFRIPIYDTLHEDNYVRNKASIYFDFEEPIVTPTKVNLFKTPTELSPNQDIYCINDSLKVSFISHFTPDTDNKFYLEATDSSGSESSFHKIDSISSSDTFGLFAISLDTNWLPSKNYLLRIRSSDYPSLTFVSYYDTIEVLEQNTLTISTPELSICEGDDITITPSWNGLEQNWYLNGDSIANNMTLRSDSIQNLDEIYAVQTDNKGCVVISDTLLFSVSNKAILTFLGDTATCGNLMDLVIATRHNIGGNGIGNLDSMFYDLGDGTLRKENDAANFSHTYTSGIYNIQLVSKTDGNCYDTLLQTIVIGADPNAGFKASHDTACLGTSVEFVDTSVSIHSQNITQAFYLDQNLLASDKDTLSHIFNTAGNYEVKLTLTDEFGCLDSTLKTVAVGNIPTAQISTTDTTVCESELPITLNSVSTGQDELIWSFNGTQYFIPAINLSPNTGSHNIQLIAKNAYCSDTTNQMIVIQDITSATFQAATEYCQNKPIMWAADSIEVGTIYTWTIDGINYSGSRVNQALSTLGSTTIQLITEITAGCNDTNSVITSVIPTGDTGMQIENICFGEPLQIVNTSTTPNALFDYDFGDGNTLKNQNFNAIETYTYASAGMYSLTQISKITPCSDTLTQMISIYPLPNASFTAVNDLSTARTVRISNNTQGASTYNWSFGDGNKSTENEAIILHTYEQSGSYDIYLKVLSDNGCADSATISFSLLDDITFHIPTSFSPNNDGINDTYNILPTEFIKSLEMKLYNRWGELVAKSNATADILPGLEQGYYLYLLEIVDVTGKIHQSQGSLTVIK